MIKSKKLKKFKNIKHGFFNSVGGVSSGQYKSLNCGIGSKDKKINVVNNLNKAGTKVVQSLDQIPESEPVLFRAHGTSTQVWKKAILKVQKC